MSAEVVVQPVPLKTLKGSSSWYDITLEEERTSSNASPFSASTSSQEDSERNSKELEDENTQEEPQVTNLKSSGSNKISFVDPLSDDVSPNPSHGFVVGHVTVQVEEQSPYDSVYDKKIASAEISSLMKSSGIYVSESLLNTCYKIIDTNNPYIRNKIITKAMGDDMTLKSQAIEATRLLFNNKKITPEINDIGLLPTPSGQFRVKLVMTGTTPVIQNTQMIESATFLAKMLGGAKYKHFDILPSDNPRNEESKSGNIIFAVIDDSTDSKVIGKSILIPIAVTPPQDQYVVSRILCDSNDKTKINVFVPPIVKKDTKIIVTTPQGPVKKTQVIYDYNLRQQEQLQQHPIEKILANKRYTITSADDGVLLIVSICYGYINVSTARKIFAADSKYGKTNIRDVVNQAYPDLNDLLKRLYEPGKHFSSKCHVFTISGPNVYNRIKFPEDNKTKLKYVGFRDCWTPEIRKFMTEKFGQTLVETEGFIGEVSKRFNKQELLFSDIQLKEVNNEFNNPFAKVNRYLVGGSSYGDGDKMRDILDFALIPEKKVSNGMCYAGGSVVLNIYDDNTSGRKNIHDLNNVRMNIWIQHPSVQHQKNIAGFSHNSLHRMIKALYTTCLGNESSEEFFTKFAPIIFDDLDLLNDSDFNGDGKDYLSLLRQVPIKEIWSDLYKKMSCILANFCMTSLNNIKWFIYYYKYFNYAIISNDDGNVIQPCGLWLSKNFDSDGFSQIGTSSSMQDKVSTVIKVIKEKILEIENKIYQNCGVMIKIKSGSDSISDKSGSERVEGDNLKRKIAGQKSKGVKELQLFCTDLLKNKTSYRYMNPHLFYKILRMFIKSQEHK